MEIKDRVISVCVIECPECNKMQDAQVTQNGTMPFATYFHKCIGCGYLIEESEWNVLSQHMEREQGNY